MRGPAVIRVVGPNLALDRIQLIAELRPNQVNRAESVTCLPGGKSSIVARAIRRLGGDVVLYGFVGGAVGETVREGNQSLGIVDRLTSIQGETRQTNVLVDLATGSSTVVNEPGPLVSSSEVEELLRAVEGDCGRDDLVVCTGSLPRGAPPDLYASIVQAVQRRGARAAVDTSGVALAEAIRAKPWLVKPNLEELGGLVGRGFAPGVSAALLDAMAGLRNAGISEVVVTLGPDGAVHFAGGGVHQVTSPSVEVANPTGAGDIFFGTLIHQVAGGGSVLDSLTWASAAAGASAARIEPDIGGASEIKALLTSTALAALQAPAVGTQVGDSP